MMDVKGHPPQHLAYYAGLVALAAFGVVDWPVVAAVAVGHLLTHNHHSRMLAQLGEALEYAR